MIEKIKVLKRQLGALNAVLYTINSLFLRLHLPLRGIKYYFVAQQLPEKPLLPERRGAGFAVSVLDATVEPHPCPRPTRVIAARYQQGAECLAAYKAEEFAGCLWYIKERYQEDEVNCLFVLDQPTTVWDFDVYVEPKFRMSPVFLKLWDAAAARLIKEGVFWSLSRISAFNPNSMASHTRMGAEIIGWAYFVCLGPLQLTIANVSPFLHVSFSAAAFPVFHLNPPKK